MGQIHHQRGVSFVSLVFLLAALALLIMAGLKLAPAYLNDFTVTTVLDGVAGRGARSPGEIRDEILKGLRVNNVDRFDTRDIDVAPSDNGYLVRLDYEDRISFIGNVDLLVTFEHGVQVPAH